MSDSTSAPANAVPVEGAKAGWATWLELTKPRLSSLSVISSVVGYAAARPEFDATVFLGLLAGTMLSAGGALTLNQWYEADTDALMTRTRGRPIPSGRIRRSQALPFGLAISIVGCLLLWLTTGALASALSAATILSYIAVYTPLKRRSRWAMEIGAVSGSLPPLIGWAAAEGSISILGWILFGVLTCWQMPHFLAIAWTHRAEYAAAHLPLHSVEAARGRVVSLGALVWTAALLPLSLAPQFLGLATWFYSIGTAALGVWFLAAAARWVSAQTDASARTLFLRSLAYLPFWMLLVSVDRLLFVA